MADFSEAKKGSVGDDGTIRNASGAKTGSFESDGSVRSAAGAHVAKGRYYKTRKWQKIGLIAKRWNR
jgi:hypothetical protein